MEHSAADHRDTEATDMTPQRPQEESTDGRIREEVLEEHRAEQGVTVKRVDRRRDDNSVEYIKVFGTREDRLASIDGGEPTTRERSVVINEMPADVAYETLLGLAEALGYRVEAK